MNMNVKNVSINLKLWCLKVIRKNKNLVLAADLLKLIN